MEHRFFHIVATSGDTFSGQGVIGLGNQLPWPKNPEDMKFFKETTMGSTIIMGRKTFESLGNKYLPGRENIVLTHAALKAPDPIKVAHSLEAAIEKATHEKVFIIGGGELYRQTKDMVDGIYLTGIEGPSGPYPGDVYYPSIPTPPFRKDEEKTRELREKYKNLNIVYLKRGLAPFGV